MFKDKSIIRNLFFFCFLLIPIIMIQENWESRWEKDTSSHDNSLTSSSRTCVPWEQFEVLSYEDSLYTSNEPRESQILASNTSQKSGAAVNDKSQKSQILANNTSQKSGAAVKDKSEKSQTLANNTSQKSGATVHDKSQEFQILANNTSQKSGAAVNDKSQKSQILASNTSQKSGAAVNDKSQKSQILANNTSQKSGVAVHDKSQKSPILANNTSQKSGAAVKDKSEKSQTLANNTSQKSGATVHDKSQEFQTLANNTSQKSDAAVHDKSQKSPILANNTSQILDVAALDESRLPFILNANSPQPLHLPFALVSDHSISKSGKQNMGTPHTSVAPPMKQSRGNPQVTLLLEGLYWQVIQDNLLASIKANGIQSGSTSSLKWVQPSFHYAPGFRVALGALLPYDQWKLSLSYTFLKTSVSRHSQNQQAEFYMLLSGHMQSLAEQVKQLWEINFQSIDCTLGREFFLSRSLSIQPQVGIKTAYPSQSWQVSYIHPVFSPGEQIFQKQKISNFFWGIGPKLGMDLVWHLPKKWAISIQPSWSLLCSRIYSMVDYKDPANSSEYIDPNAIVHGAQTATAVIPQMEMWLGVEWSHFYTKKRSIQLNLGYDVQYFWNEANILAFVQLPQGNLTLQGPTLSLLFGF